METLLLSNQTDQSDAKITESDRKEFHVADVTEPILSVGFLCENGVETRLARSLFLKHGERNEPLIKESGVLRQSANRS